MLPPPPTSTLFPYTTLFRSVNQATDTIQKLGSRNGFAVDETDDPGAFTQANLARYRGVVFLSADKATLDSGEERSEEHTSELQSRENLVCRLLLEKKKKITT